MELTNDYLIDSIEEQEKITSKINSINDSGIFDDVYNFLISFCAELRKAGINNTSLAGRVKKIESAREKILTKRLSADQIHDLIGYMLVVDTPDEYKKVIHMLRSKMPPDSFIHDFDGSLPENNGYSSFHMGLKVLDVLSEEDTKKHSNDLTQTDVELQVKTKGMYIAQESTHDTIYKNSYLDKNQKNMLQTIMFPLIEKIINIQMYNERFEIFDDSRELFDLYQSISSEKENISELIGSNRDFIESNMTLIEDILKEFVSVMYIEKIKNDPFIEMDRSTIKELKEMTRQVADALVAREGRSVLLQDGITGFSSIDHTYTQIMNCTPEQIAEMYEIIQEQDREEMLEMYSPIDKTVSPETRKPSLLSQLRDEINSHENDYDIGA